MSQTIIRKTENISERGKDYTQHQVELWDYQGVKGRCCCESEFQGKDEFMIVSG